MKLVLRLCVALLACGVLHAQNVVVSEYRNDVDQALEWTEIVVVADNIDLRGFMVTDNRGTGDMRQSGPRFKNLPLWQHVRAGTIILIYHGTRIVVQKEDTDPADGYLELSQFDTRFFDIVNVDGAAGSNGLNINQDRDFVQVLRADTVHVHGLMHGAEPGPTWLNTPNPKAGYDTSNIGPRSVCVSGRSIAAYNAGRNNDSVSTGRYMTPGLPNSVDDRKLLLGRTDVNYLLWQEWREPKWSSTPTVTVTDQTATKHVFSWTPVVDTYPDDTTTGYMILRDTSDFAAFPSNAIVDGTIYTVGQQLFGAKIMAIQPTRVGASYGDSTDLVCGTSYTYRMYAYRYKADDNLGAPTLPTTARGRQYSPVYAQSARITKAFPTKPVIAASRLQICPGDTVTLTTTTNDPKLMYQWTVNGGAVSVSGTTRIVVASTGTYRLRIVAPGGCSAESDPITISPLPGPSVVLNPSGTREICNGDSVVLTAQAAGATVYEWRRNGVILPGVTGTTYVARQAGEYQVFVRTSEGCPAISRTMTISFPDVQYSVTPSVVDFGVLGSCQSSAPASMDVTNTGTRDITIAQISLPVGFAIVSPAPGFILKPNERVTVQLLFVPNNVGVTSGTAEVRATPCDVQRTFTVRGERIKGEVTLNNAGIDFGTFTACPSGSDIRAVKSFTLTNTGTSTVTVRAPLVSPPFYLLTAFGTKSLAAGEAFTIDLQYRPFGADQNRAIAAVIRFPYVSQSCNDTLQASLTAASYYPSADASESSIDVGFVLNCVGFADTAVTITNPSQVPVTLVRNTSSSVILTGLPVTIPPGTSRVVPARITPPTGGANFTVLDTMVYTPCTLPLAVEYVGTWFRGKFSANPTSVDVPAVDLCTSDTASSTQTFTLIASQTNGLRAPIRSVRVGGPFRVDLVPGTTITSQLTVTVTYTPTRAGVDVDTVTVVFGPCDDTVRVVVRGEARSTGRSVTIDNADFGIIDEGGFSERTMIITNTGTSNLRVESLDGVVAPFSVVSSTPPLPATIPAGGVVTVVVRYTHADVDRRDSTEVSVFTSLESGDCADTLTLLLRGATSSRRPIEGLVVIIPDNLTADVGTRVDIPVTLTSPTSLQGAGITELSFTVHYDGSIVQLTDVTTTVTGLTVTASPNGKGRTTVSVRGSEIVAANPLFTLLGTTYLGGARQTPLDIDTVLSDRAIIRSDDGRLALTGDCAVETQVVKLGSLPTMHVREASATEVLVEITTLTHDPANVRLVDIDGRIVGSISLQTSPGRHVVRLACDGIANGAYLVQFVHGRFNETTAVVITR